MTGVRDGLNFPLLSHYGAVHDGADVTLALIAAEADAAATFIDLGGLNVTTTRDVLSLSKRYFNGVLTCQDILAFAPTGPTIQVKNQWPIADFELGRSRTKTPILNWRGKRILWLGNSIAAFGGVHDSYPVLFANALGATVANLAFAGSYCAFDYMRPGDSQDQVKALSMTEVDRLAMIEMYGKESYYNDTDPNIKSSLMTCDCRIKSQFVKSGFDCVVLDHAHNDASRLVGTLAPLSWVITAITLGTMARVNGTIVKTLTLAIPGHEFLEGDGIALHPIEGIPWLSHAAGRVLSVNNETVVAAIDTTGMTGTFLSGMAIRLDRSTIYGSYEFVIHYILWCVGRYGNPACKVIMAGSFNEWTANRNEPNRMYSIRCCLERLAMKHHIAFFDIAWYLNLSWEDRRDQGDGSIYSIYCPDGTHPTTAESRQVIANHWLEWAQGGALPTIDSHKLLMAGSSSAGFVDNREALYSDFIGGFSTPSTVHGDYAEIYSDDFSISPTLSGWTLNGTAPILSAAPWDLAEQSLVFDLTSTRNDMTRSVVWGACNRASFDLYLPSVTGLVASGWSILTVFAMGWGGGLVGTVIWRSWY